MDQATKSEAAETRKRGYGGAPDKTCLFGVGFQKDAAFRKEAFEASALNLIANLVRTRWSSLFLPVTRTPGAPPRAELVTGSA